MTTDVEQPRIRTSNASGLLLVLLLGTLLLSPGLLAQIVDHVDSQDNDVTTDTFIAAGADDVQAAIVNEFESCDDAVYSDGPITAFYTGETVDINNGAPQDGSTSQICVKNVSLGTGELYWSIVAFDSTEAGACAQVEIDAGDSSCGDGDAGEAASIVQVKPAWTSNPALDQNLSSNCTTTNYRAVDSASTPEIANSLFQPNKYCRFNIFSLVSGA
ncbi:MAG: hypothetical protein R3249_11710, partial [Nitriliruptorales bacterium]|nr:hypothetical protein [Nitriliruptorales bacterium]